MAAALQTAFAGLALRAGGSVPRRQHQFSSNGTASKVAMKSKLTFQVEVRKLICCMLLLRAGRVRALVRGG